MSCLASGGAGGSGRDQGSSFLCSPSHRGRHDPLRRGPTAYSQSLRNWNSCLWYKEGCSLFLKPACGFLTPVRTSGFCSSFLAFSSQPLCLDPREEVVFPVPSLPTPHPPPPATHCPGTLGQMDFIILAVVFCDLLFLLLFSCEAHISDVWGGEGVSQPLLPLPYSHHCLVSCNSG